MHKCKAAIILVIVFSLTLVGCGSAENRKNSEGNLEFVDYSDPIEPEGLTIVRDKKFGCEYIVYSDTYKAAIHPRLNSDGTPYCNTEEETK